MLELAWEPMKETPDKRLVRTYRPDIDGIRAIAVLSVVLYHASEHLLPGGFTGVDIFFVISGYLIGGHIYSEISRGTFSFFDFYRRRAKRILPAFYLVLSLVFVLSVVLLTPVEIKVLATSAISSLLSASNVYFYRRLGDYFVTAASFNPLLMTWSLGVEEQFYVIAPLIIVSLNRIHRKFVLPSILILSLLSFAIAVRKIDAYPSYVFYLLPSRAWELGAGVFLALGELTWGNGLSKKWSQIVSVLGLALLILPMYLLAPSTPFPGAAALPSVIGTSLVIMTPRSWFNGTVLSFAPAVFLGRISYSWYLLHYPILVFMGVLSGRKMSSLVTMIAVLLSLVAAVLSYYLIEQPFRNSRRLSKPLLIRYATVTIVFLLAFTFLRQSGWTLNGRYPEVSQFSEGQSNSCIVDYNVDEPELSKACYDAADTRPAAVIWGDSHSAALAPVLRQIAANQGYALVQMSKSSCLPVIGAAIAVANHPNEARNCMHFNNEVLRLTLANRHVRVVIMTGVWTSPFKRYGGNTLIGDEGSQGVSSASDSVRKLFSVSLANAVRPLCDAGIKVVLIDDVPVFSFDPLMRYRTSVIPARRWMASMLGEYHNDMGFAAPDQSQAADTATELMKSVQLQFPGVELIDLRSVLCREHDSCHYFAEGKLFYRDPNHVTVDGAKYALRGFSLPIL